MQKAFLVEKAVKIIAEKSDAQEIRKNEKQDAVEPGAGKAAGGEGTLQKTPNSSAIGRRK